VDNICNIACPVVARYGIFLYFRRIHTYSVSGRDNSVIRKVAYRKPAGGIKLIQLMLKSIYTLLISLLVSTLLPAQSFLNTYNNSNSNKKERLIPSLSFSYKPGRFFILKRDTPLYNSYGNLLNDDPQYNKKAPLWVPIFKLVQINAFTWAIDRYILNADYSKGVGFNTWRNNLKSSWVWDTDNFYYNFFAHPYSGSAFFNAARSYGYNFYASAPFTLFGSAMWEWFGENTPPSKNDLINTTISGIFLGEIMYRLSSNILDDRTTGVERVFRELAAGILNPTRLSNRLFSGNVGRVIPKDIYQREPMNVTIAAGIRRINENLGFDKGNIGGLINAELIYGNPFENRFRKPFDFFNLRIGLNVAPHRKLLEDITGYGLLIGNNTFSERFKMLAGVFQHYDYWNTKYFEIGVLGLGGGIRVEIPLAGAVKFESSTHLDVVPFGASNSDYTVEGERDYNFAGGMEAKTENTLHLGIASISANYYLYWLKTYVGERGNNFLGILLPRVTVRLYKNFGAGAELLLFHKDSYLYNFPNVHTRNTELRFYLMISSGYFGL
jgi:uncharacterized protein DUF3943